MGQTTSNSLKALALSVLAASKNVPSHTSAFSLHGTGTNPANAQKPEALGACGSAECAGCYEVAPGVRIHPPKCGEEYRKLLERWEAKGRVQ